MINSPEGTDFPDTPSGEQSRHIKRTETRRQDDTILMAFVRDTYKWFARGPRILALLGGAATGAAFVASWLGAQSSSPGQRITSLETAVETRFAQVEQRQDTLAAVVDSLRNEVAAGRVEDAAFRADVQLLLKLACRSITDADLREDCINRGARRR